MKKALILALSDPSGDPRPRRAIELLNEMGYEVDTVSFKITGSLKTNKRYELRTNPDSRYLMLMRRAFIAAGLVISNLLSWNMAKDFVVSTWFRLWPVRRALKENQYELVFVEDLFFLPMVMKHKAHSHIIFDAREYYPRQWEHSFIFRVVDQPIRKYLCRRYLPLCEEVITVSYGLADEYLKEFGIKSHVIRSIPDGNVGNTSKTSDHQIKMVHHGVANRNRKLENMVQLTELLDERFTFDMYLQGEQAYINELKVLCEHNKRVRILPPVEFKGIIPMLRNYDIGLFYVEPVTFNLTHCLPNKLFEFIQAGLMVAIGPSPDMARIVKEHQCGIVADSFDLKVLAADLNELSSTDIDEFKNKSHEAAEVLNWGEESKLLKKVIQNTLS